MVTVLAAAIAVLTGVGTADAPAAQIATERAIPAYAVYGPKFRIPCRTDKLAEDVASVELWYSQNGGKTWKNSGAVLGRNETQFEFHSPNAGYYLFTTRVRYKDGRAAPKDHDKLYPEMVIYVGAEVEAPWHSRFADQTEQLEDELTRVELELIAKEIKQLAAADRLDEQTAAKITKLRARLREIREQGAKRDSARDESRPLPHLPPPTISDGQAPPAPPRLNQPSIPTVPVPPVVR